MTESQTNALLYPFPVAPQPGELLHLTGGVHWLRMPLPFALDHINLWALEDAAGWTLVDTGIDAVGTRELWLQLLQGPLAGKPVLRIVVTHFHPDHIGVAGWLAETLRVPLWMTPLEWQTANEIRALTVAELTERTTRRYAAAGTDRPVPAQETGMNLYAAHVTPLPADFTELDAGDVFGAGGVEWQVVIGQGHSPQLAALHSAELDVLISGDQVLPRISSHVGVPASRPEQDSLSQYMNSLTALRELPADTLVLPSHGLPFRGLHTRIDQLIAHHHERLALTLVTCRTASTVAEVTAALFPRRLDAIQFGFALDETLAHLNRLVRTGEIARRTSSNGVDFYQTI